MKTKKRKAFKILKIVSISLLCIVILFAGVIGGGYLLLFPSITNFPGDILYDQNVYAQTDGDGWSIGFAKEVITPVDIDTYTYYIAGFNSNNVVDGVLDDVYTRAVYISHNTDGSDGVVLAAVDCVGLTRKDIQDIKVMLASFVNENNIQSVNIMSTHNHETVDTQGLWGKSYLSSGRDEHYMRFLKEKTVKAIKDAFDNKTQGDFYLGTAKVGEELIHDRREPIVFEDTLVRLAFRPYDNQYGNIYIINFGMHIEGLAQNNRKISADFIKFMGDVIYDTDTGSDFVFINGAIGGLITLPFLDEVYKLGDVEYAQEKTEEYGNALGEIVMSVDNELPLNPRVNFASKRVFLPVQNIGFAILKVFKVIHSDVYRGKKGFEIVTELSYLEIGSGENVFKAMLLPGEIFPELALGGFLNADESPLGKEVSYEKTFYEIMGDTGVKAIFGLANDQLGYIIPENDFLLHKTLPFLNIAYDKFGREHYEEVVSTGQKTAGILLSSAEILMSEFKQSEE